MRLQFRQEDCDWLCDQARIKPDSRMRHAFEQAHVHGQDDEAIAAEMGVVVASVRGYLAEVWWRIRHRSQKGERLIELRDTLQEILNELEGEWEDEDLLNIRAYAGALLAAMHGPPSPSPHTPTMAKDHYRSGTDGKGRKVTVYKEVGVRSPLVSIEDAAAAVREVAAERAAAEEREWVGVAPDYPVQLLRDS